MLDCVGFTPPEGSRRLPDDLPPRTIIDWCQTVWTDFKEFARSAAQGVIVHALAQLRSHYPVVDLQRVVTGYARRIDATKITRLEDKAEESVKRLTGDVDLFDEGGSGSP